MDEAQKKLIKCSFVYGKMRWRGKQLKNRQKEVSCKTANKLMLKGRNKWKNIWKSISKRHWKDKQFKIRQI